MCASYAAVWIFVLAVVLPLLLAVWMVVAITRLAILLTLVVFKTAIGLAAFLSPARS